MENSDQFSDLQKSVKNAMKELETFEVIGNSPFLEASRNIFKQLETLEEDISEAIEKEEIID